MAQRPTPSYVFDARFDDVLWLALSPGREAMFRKVYQRGESVSDVARDLGISVSAMRGRLKTAVGKVELFNVRSSDDLRAEKQRRQSEADELEQAFKAYEAEE
jgi:transposase-like protein